MATVVLLRGKGAFQGMAVVLRIERCILCIEMAAEITPLGAAFQATWSIVSILETMAKHMCQGFLGKNTACVSVCFVFLFVVLYPSFFCFCP